MLTNKGNIIISSTSTPSAAEIASQFSPNSLKVDIESLASEDSGRSDDGYMHINWLYSRVRKINITLKPDIPSNIATILNKVQGRIYFITYGDPIDNSEKTKEVYTSNSSGNGYSGVLFNGLLQDVSFNAIELGGEV